MFGRCAAVCWLALLAAAPVRALGGDEPEPERAPQAALPEPEPEPAAREAEPARPPVPATAPAEGADPAVAIQLARADLERLTEALLEDAEARADAPAASDIEVNRPPAVLTSAGPSPSLSAKDAEPVPDLEWLTGVELPDIETRLHPVLLRQLLYYRDDPRGRAQIRLWLERSGRYDDMIRQKLREVGVPEDLLFVAMVESGFDPNSVSSADAVGMWQWVESSAVDYGITRDRWLDQRKSPELATVAAARFFKDLYAKLGSWPLSMAAYNMGYGALLRSIRKYNTNDFWLLSRLEAGLPYETVIYVAKIIACAIVAHNPERFGLADLVKDPPLPISYVQVAGGLSLGRLASAAGMPVDELAALNPELLRKRIPPDLKSFSLRIPSDRKQRFERRFPELAAEGDSYAIHVLRFGERLKDVAEMYGTTERKLRALNDLSDGDPVRPGMRLRVPDVEHEAPPAAVPLVVGVPDRVFHYPDRRQIFYRVQTGDSPARIASFFRVSLDELRLWNAISTDTTLHTGMVLQLFAPKGLDLAGALYLTPDRVRPLVIGSDEFFDYHEALRDRVRVRYRVRAGDSMSSLAERYDLSVGSIARINAFSREKTLQADAEIILYVPSKDAAALDARHAARD